MGGYRHVLADQFEIGAQATGDLTLLLTAIQTTSKFIATNVRKARINNLYVLSFIYSPSHICCERLYSYNVFWGGFRVGLAGETNVQGEEQKKLDVLSNDIMINSLRASGKTAVLVSEELEEAVFIDDRHRGKYCVVFDPLDGSSNIDAGVNIGTIFGIYHVVSSLLLGLLSPPPLFVVSPPPWILGFLSFLVRSCHLMMGD